MSPPRPPAYVLGTVPAHPGTLDAQPARAPAVLHRDGTCLAQAHPTGAWEPTDPDRFTPTPEETP